MEPWIAALSLLSSAAFAHDSYFAGTRWHLLSIQSMDDTQGGTRIDDASRFSLHFQPDGQAVFRLDGNRGTGHYQVSPSADLSNGQMSFGPVAATRALCQPPHLDVHATVAACVPPLHEHPRLRSAGCSPWIRWHGDRADALGRGPGAPHPVRQRAGRGL